MMTGMTKLFLVAALVLAPIPGTMPPDHPGVFFDCSKGCAVEGGWVHIRSAHPVEIWVPGNGFRDR